MGIGKPNAKNQLVETAGWKDTIILELAPLA
jgi:hypothetical protein